MIKNVHVIMYFFLHSCILLYVHNQTEIYLCKFVICVFMESLSSDFLISFLMVCVFLW